jgi:Tol biopolymer transport system component
MKPPHRARAAAVLSLLAATLSCDTNVNDGDGDTTVTTLVSRSSAGVQAFGVAGQLSNTAVVSGDGRFVAFVSSAPNLVADKATTTRDVFRRNLETGTTVRISLDIGGGDPNGECYNPSISKDGSRIAFESTATDLDALDGSAAASIYVWQEGAAAGVGTVSLVSRDGGVNGDGTSTDPAISADGRSIAFASTAANLAGVGAVGYNNIYVRRLADFAADPSATRLVSRVSGAAGAVGNALSISPTISTDGRHIAFRSDATNLDSVLTDANGFRDVYVRDTGAVPPVTVRVSVPAGGGEGNGNSEAPSISGDGTIVAFESLATNFVTGDVNAARDVYVKNLATGAVTLASRAADGSISTGGALPATSEDGRFVVFSTAGILLPSDTNGFEDVYRFSIPDGAVIRVSLGPQGRQADNASTLPSLSSDGSVAAFESDASNLDDGDGNANRDVFARQAIR